MISCRIRAARPSPSLQGEAESCPTLLQATYRRGSKYFTCDKSFYSADRSGSILVRQNFVGSASQYMQAAEERQQTRQVRTEDSIEDAAASPVWRRTYDHVQHQVAFFTRYPDANEAGTSPSQYLDSSASATGSGSGPIPSFWGTSTGSARAAHNAPGQPIWQTEIEDHWLTTNAASAPKLSHKSSIPRQDTA